MNKEEMGLWRFLFMAFVVSIVLAGFVMGSSLVYNKFVYEPTVNPLIKQCENK